MHANAAHMWAQMKAQLAVRFSDVTDNQTALSLLRQSKKISNDQELIQSDPISCPQNQKGNN